MARDRRRVVGRIAGDCATAGTGAIVGRVIDKATGTALPGADVSVEGTVIATAADRDGNFRLKSIGREGDSTGLLVSQRPTTFTAVQRRGRREV